MNQNHAINLASVVRQRDIEHVAQFMWDGDEIAPEKKYTLFITAHFGGKQQQTAELHAAHFRNKLDRRVLGRGKRLYKALFIEEGTTHSYNERHAHWLLEKPAHMTRRDFEAVFAELWRDICGSDNIQTQRISKKEGGLAGVVQYLTKERDWQGLLGSKSFIADFSDNARLQKNRQQRAA